MITLEVPKDVADTLAEKLKAQGETVDIIQEERFFGDASVVTMVLENTESIVVILAGAVTLFRESKAILTKDDGSSMDISKMTPDEIKARMVL